MTSAVHDPGFRSLGQDVSQRMVRRAAARDELRRTLLVHGPAGSGKGAFVDDLLALLFCTEADPSGRPCNSCRGCRDARSRSHPDLLVGSPERWREERGTGESIVAAARRWLLASAGSPVASAQRVILIEHVDAANEQTQNALLKALEEPGPRQMFVLVADEPTRLLSTIRSRSQPLRIGPVPREVLVSALADRARMPHEEADDLARVADGLAGRAFGYADNRGLWTWRKETLTELLDLLERGPADRFGSVRDLLARAVRQGAALPVEATEDDDPAARSSAAEQRQGALLITRAWLDLARDLLVAAAGRPQDAPSTRVVHGVESAAGRIRPTALRRFVDLLERIHDGLRQNAAPRLAMEVAMLAWPSLPRSR